MSRLLFICSKNQWRSPTAEELFRNHPLHQAKSAGTSDKANIKVNTQHIAWADVIFVMERKHKQLLSQKFGNLLNEKQVIVLDIEDDYQYNDPELIEMLKIALADFEV